MYRYMYIVNIVRYDLIIHNSKISEDQKTIIDDVLILLKH